MIAQRSQPRKARYMTVGQHQWYHFGVGAPPMLVYFTGDWDVHWGCTSSQDGVVSARNVGDGVGGSLELPIRAFAMPRLARISSSFGPLPSFAGREADLPTDLAEVPGAQKTKEPGCDLKRGPLLC